jgi:hypothetical protein
LAVQVRPILKTKTVLVTGLKIWHNDLPALDGRGSNPTIAPIGQTEI